MSLLSGLLSPAINVATNAAGSYRGAQANAAHDSMQGALQRFALERQQQQDQIQEAVRQRQAQSEALKDEQVRALTAHTVRQTAAPQLGDPGYASAVAGVEAAKDAATLPTKEALEHDKIDYDARHGYHAPPPPAFENVAGTDATGKPINLPFNKRTGTYDTKNTVGGKMPSSGSGVSADINKARLSSAGEQIANADDAMTKFEDDVQAGRAHMDPKSLELARIAMSQGPGSAIATAALKRLNKRVYEYVRSASEASTAERMITPRGGSNAMMQAEKILMQAGAGGDPATIEQARKYRKTLRHALPVDQQGGITPPTAGGSAVGGISSQERAALKQQGFTDEQIQAYEQGQHE